MANQLVSLAHTAAQELLKVAAAEWAHLCAASSQEPPLHSTWAVVHSTRLMLSYAGQALLQECVCHVLQLCGCSICFELGAIQLMLLRITRDLQKESGITHV
jgi:hypothetical protein